MLFASDDVVHKVAEWLPLNALLGEHKVKASRMPGKARRCNEVSYISAARTIPTLFWTPEIRRVRCPGLVIPSHVPMEVRLLSGGVKKDSPLSLGYLTISQISSILISMQDPARPARSSRPLILHPQRIS